MIDARRSDLLQKSLIIPRDCKYRHHIIHVYFCFFSCKYVHCTSNFIIVFVLRFKQIKKEKKAIVGRGNTHHQPLLKSRSRLTPRKTPTVNDLTTWDPTSQGGEDDNLVSLRFRRVNSFHWFLHRFAVSVSEGGLMAERGTCPRRLYWKSSNILNYSLHRLLMYRVAGGL